MNASSNGLADFGQLELSFASSPPRAGASLALESARGPVSGHDFAVWPRPTYYTVSVFPSHLRCGQGTGKWKHYGFRFRLEFLDLIETEPVQTF